MQTRSLQHLVSITLLLGVAYAGTQGVGYDDTPMIPGSKYRVHDSQRTPPPKIEAGRAGSPPSDAIVLFDGTNLDAWNGGPWKIEDGYMEVNGSGAMKTKQKFGDVQLHLEWASPAEVQGDSQGRGNSGVFFMEKYEVQVLDSYENRTYADGQAGALYGQFPPLVNASRKPGEWQTYDIIFEAPQFEDGELVKAAYVTVIHNGVLLHHRRSLIGATTHRALAKYSEHGPGPLQLQDHGNPVRFRNIWVRELKGYDSL